MATSKYDAPEHTVNILLATFAGLGLPRTLSIPTKTSASIGDVCVSISRRLPCEVRSLIVTTISNKQLVPTSQEPVSTLLNSPDDTLLSVRLSRPLCGGKGGFGSQLRAAGGRMSSRKSRDRQNQTANSSNRNLDGRRLRTVDEAKRLADYLAIKPEMDKKQKEERKKRLEAVVEAAERREQEIKNATPSASKARLNAEYVEGKQLAEEKTIAAIQMAIKEGTMQWERTGSESSVDEDEASENDARQESSASDESASDGVNGGPNFFGWDEDEDDEDDDEDDEDDDVDDVDDDDERDKREIRGGDGVQVSGNAYEGKGKAKAI